jgi:hypothetical protein
MLGITEDEVRELVGSGKIREYRDAGKVYYKRTEVVKVEPKAGGSSVIDLQATGPDSPDAVSLDDNESFASALSSLADSSASLGALDESPATDDLPKVGSQAGGSSISFAPDDDLAKADIAAAPSDINLMDIPEDLPAKPGAARGGMSEIPDLGLSGSSIISLEPSDSGIAPSPASKEDTKVTKVGISVFDEEELGIKTDPMGETQISSGMEAFDAVGSGSGLLDLTQESDDTSLGAALLDAISPTDASDAEIEAAPIEGETITEDGSAVAVMEDTAGVAAIGAAPAMPSMAARASYAPMAGVVPMNVCLGLGILGLGLLGIVTAAALQGTWPSTLLGMISTGPVHWGVFGGLAVISVVAGVLSIMADRK